VPEEDTVLLEAEHFLHCVETGEDPITDGRSQRRALQVVTATYESMRTGRVVVLTE
jgi:predicted dehydrogenase